MRKVKLSEKLLSGSVNDCIDFLNKKRKRRLPSKKIKAVIKLIEKRRKDNSKIADTWIKTPMLRLAVTKLFYEGKGIPVEIDGETKYNYDLGEIFNKIDEILKEANKEGKQKELKEFCE